MDNKQNTQDLELDDILNEFHHVPGQTGELPDIDTAGLDKELAAQMEEVDHLLEELPELPEIKVEAVDVNAIQLDPVEGQVPSAVTDDTIPMELPEKSGEEKEVPMGNTVRIPVPEQKEEEQPAEAAVPEEKPQEPDFIPPPPIVFTPRSRLRELKKQLVAGPEKRYYELSEIGLGRVQVAALAAAVITVLCALVSGSYSLGFLPESRLRFVIFTQFLGMMTCGLLGCHLMMDSVSDLFKGKFTVNTLLTVTFFACCADAVMSLYELRVPCCVAFCLEMTMALWQRYQKRSTEIAQMDTMRKAVRLNSLVKVPDFYEGKAGLLRGEGQVAHFMDTYNAVSGPEMVQNACAVVSLLGSIAIAVFAGMLHGKGMAVQIFAATLLVSVPASSFVCLSRPMAILERRLHMVGTVLCGWKGVKKLAGKAVFPLRDEDLFPQGSTKLNGVKFYGDRATEEVVSYTTSLIIAAGGGLVPAFRQMLSSRSGTEYPVENFQNYGSGGIGGEVCGEPVLLGNLHFLQDMGVEIPEGTMVNQAVYASIDGQLCAVFAISYAKMRSAAAGLVSLCGYRKITPVLTGGDFMLTDSLLRAKFGISTRRIAFPERKVRSELNSYVIPEETPALALTTREDLVSAAYAVSGARALRTASKLGVAIHLIGGALGLLIMAALAYLGATQLLTPIHVLLYQLVWMLPGLLITEWTRIV
ncbi:MAG: hypothetical protein IJ001_02620 [Oscillospiraceae bacterium]|nr:hypothetical protein [Oscillospiraceae bacterium]